MTYMTPFPGTKQIIYSDFTIWCLPSELYTQLKFNHIKCTEMETSLRNQGYVR